MSKTWRIAIMALLAGILLPGCDKTAPEKLNLCQDGSIVPLLMFTQEKGYFQKENLDIAFHPLGDGKNAVASLLAGRCDAAVVSEAAIAQYSQNRPDFSIIATLGTSDNASRIVADRRRGINSASDLKGKRIGVRRGSISHMFLDTLLKKQGIGTEQVSIRFFEPQLLSEALTRGQIDALASTDIYLMEAANRLGDNATVIEEPGLSRNSFAVIFRNGGLKPGAESANRFLKALARGETTASRNIDEIARIISRRRDISEKFSKDLINHHRIELSLPQHLLITLDDNYYWMQEQGILQSGRAPNHLDIIDRSLLERIAPSSVRIQKRQR